MTALGADANRSVMDWGGNGSYPVKAASQIYKGSIVTVDADGYAIAAADTANTWVVGVATENVLGGTANGDEWIKVEAGRAYLFAASSITQAMLGEPMYVVDDNTVDDAAGATHDVMVGLLVKYVSSTSGWVYVAPTYSLGQIAGVTSSAGELNYLDITAVGAVEASKACVVDANKDLGDFRNLDCQNLDAGASGTVGTVDIFPATAARGKLSISCTNQAGNTTVGLVADAMAAARTITIPDPGAAANVLMTTGAATATSATTTEISTLAGVTGGAVTASKALVADASKQLAGLCRPIHLAQGTDTLTAAESGTVFVCSVDAVITLPDCTTCPGAEYTIQCGALSVGTGLSISPNAADYIMYVTSVNDKDLINTGATDVVGDSVTIVSDGVDGWLVTAIKGTWAKEA